jgi:peptidoglycan/LPS O-acetylase OafA/YrhL
MNTTTRQFGGGSPDRDNNFNLLRMAAAAAVLVSHAYPLSLGKGVAEPLQYYLGMNLGTLAVYSFFAISGYFITQSFQRNPSIVDFCIARVFRIYPALLVALILTVVVLGPVFSVLSLSEFVTHAQVFSYIPANLSLVRLQYELPGVFEKNPYPGAINGSLWTLAYEAGCYAMVASVGIWGILANTRRFAFLLISYAVFYGGFSLLHLHSERFEEIHQLTFPFVLGMTLFHFRGRIAFRFDVCGVLFLASFLLYGRPGFKEIFILSWCYALFCIGFTRSRTLSRYNLLGDYSYGTYIYAFPVEQVIAASVPNSTPLVLMALGFPITLGLATLSWHFIEKPASGRRGRAANVVKQWLGGHGARLRPPASKEWPVESRPPAEAPAPGAARNPRP